MKYFLLIVLSAAAGAGSAIAHHESGGQHSGQAQAPAAGQKTGKGTGLIQQIDRERGAITVKHGPLQGLNMPAMTMTFLVKDKAMLSNLQPLQKVDFELTYDGKNYRITNIR
ncbi:MAG: copper-binding protein [Betaproteobacteria bacterium]|nr:copper-binding protein [Betaproteobacteria bacterium]